jgi:hypothetical protein
LKELFTTIRNTAICEELLHFYIAVEVSKLYKICFDVFGDVNRVEPAQNLGHGLLNDNSIALILELLPLAK